MKPNTPLLNILAPRSVAILGASDNPLKAGGRPIAYTQRYGFSGAVFPINPNRKTVQGLVAYPNLMALPSAPDVVVVSVGSSEVDNAITQSVAIGARAAVIYSSGFAELGAGGVLPQQRLVAAARTGGLRLLGPNTQGMANFQTGAVLHFSTMINEIMGVDGPVAIVSQSGAGSSILYGALRRMGLGVRYMISTGNEADIDAAEAVGAIVTDPDIRLVLLYIESLRDASALAHAAALAHANDVPILAVKAGRSSAGQATAASHTGAMANEDALVDAFLHKHGIVRLADFEELTEYAKIFAGGWRPRGRNVVAISNSGATCVLAADGAEEFGLTLPQFEREGADTLRKVLPEYVDTRNPIDMTTALLGKPDIFGDALNAVAQHQPPDMVFVGFPVGGEGYDFEKFSAAAQKFCVETLIPVAVGATQEWVAQAFQSKGIPVYSSERRAMRAFSLLANHVESHIRLARHSKQANAHTPATPRRSEPDGQQVLDEVESLEFLAKAGVPAMVHRRCRSEADVRAAFAELGTPLVVKGVSRNLTHKSEHGLVRLNITSADEAVAEFKRMGTILDRLSARNDGVLLAPQSKGDFELAIGAHVDPVFGPVVMVSHGGVLIEALADAQFLLTPFDMAEAIAAISRLRVARLMGAVRGMAAVDLTELASMLVALGNCVAAPDSQVVSVDANPVIVSRGDIAPVMVDAVVIQRKSQS